MHEDFYPLKNVWSVFYGSFEIFIMKKNVNSSKFWIFFFNKQVHHIVFCVFYMHMYESWIFLRWNCEMIFCGGWKFQSLLRQMEIKREILKIHLYKQLFSRRRKNSRNIIRLGWIISSLHHCITFFWKEKSLPWKWEIFLNIIDTEP